MRRLAILVIAVACAAAVGLWLIQGAPSDPAELAASLDTTWPRTVALVLLAAVLLVSVAAGGPRLKEVARAVLLWGALALILVATYAYRSDLERIGRTTVSAVIPGLAVETGGGVTVSRGADGHFRINGSVNGAPVTFLLDTGATMVLLTAEDARAAGIDPPRSAYSLPVSTANGIARVAPASLDSVTVGSIEESDVGAAVAPPGQVSSSLLGMSFLSRLYRFEITGDRLILEK